MRLSPATLSRLPTSVAQPAYERSAVTPGIVHLGIGAFHRAHQAVMTEAALCASAGQPGGLGWGIIAASLRNPDTRDALVPQDGLYTVSVRAPEGEHLVVIGSVLAVLVAPEDPEALVAAMADPRIRIVSLTVTEKGYCHDPATGTLNAAHPDIVHDLAAPDAPRSAPGYLVAALRRRFALGLKPFTVLCCDNLPANGRTVKRVLTALAALRDTSLAAWIDREVACPCTMVDRIVPATSDEDRVRVAALIGMTDAWPVVSEPFTQWVIEDHFPAGRPSWEEGGAQFVADVGPYELMKLRMLNGAHSALAYLGYLAGHETVADASNDPLFVRYLQGLWAEIAPTLPPGLGHEAYAIRLLERFQNRSIRHRLWQIAMDGSQKLPQRLLGTIRARLSAGQPIDHLALAVAAWMQYAGGIDEAGAAIDVRDPLAARLRAICDAAGAEPHSRATALCAVTEVFDDDLSQDQLFIGLVAAALQAVSGSSRFAIKTVSRGADDVI